MVYVDGLSFFLIVPVLDQKGDIRKLRQISVSTFLITGYVYRTYR